MQCLMRRSMLVLGALSLSNCATVHPVAVDSYCLEYNKVVQEKGDGAITASPGVKKRILANELNYARCGAK